MRSWLRFAIGSDVLAIGIIGRLAHDGSLSAAVGCVLAAVLGAALGACLVADLNWCDHVWEPEGFADWRCAKCGHPR